MRTLALDCATEACSVALFEDAVLLAGSVRVAGRGHAESLVPMIAALPGRGRAQRIAVATGPGSFTGLRVGLAAARALALAWQADLRGYSSLALVAAMARAEHGPRPVCVCMTGGHGEWFVAGYDAAGAELVAPVSLAPAAAAALMPGALVAGSEAAAMAALRGTRAAAVLLPDARMLALLGESAFSPDARLRYGRAPDARLPGAAP